VGRLNLDLSGSRQKLARAVKHTETLNREIPASIEQRDPYSIHCDFDEQTGVLRVLLRPQAADLRFSVILGELVHDLRSALDHIVATLVLASNATLTKKHQFPIESDETRFDRLCGTASSPLGQLKGIKYGFSDIRDVQPFHLKPDPDHAGLALLNRLSNSDKHRTVLPFADFPESHSLRLEVTGNCDIIEQGEPPGGLVWNPDGDTEMHRFRFAPPFPTEFDPKADMRLSAVFMDRPFPPEYNYTALIPMESVAGMCDQVQIVIDRIAAL
jgi:hypothetical protein